MIRVGGALRAGDSLTQQLRLGLSLALWGGAAVALGAAGVIPPVQAQQSAPPLTVPVLGEIAAEFDQLRAQAAAGQAEAQYLLGRHLQRGTGPLQDYAEAVQWFRLAAEQGVVGAQSQLGQTYLHGLGVTQDISRALHWLELAATSGRAEPLYQLANLLEQGPESIADPARAAQLYQKATDLGHADAAVSLGVLYQNGLGVAQDLMRARQLYEAPAAAGHARAQNNLGLIYVRGEGGEQDYLRAAQLFQAAAKQGLAVALNNLGTLYENGFGVALDEARAQALYRQAADLGRGGAALISTTRPGSIYPVGVSFPDVSAAGLAALQEQAQAGDAVAQFQLGWLMLQPETRPDPQSAPDPQAVPSQEFRQHQQAAALLQAAAGKGHPEAMINLALLYVEGRVLPQDHMLAYMWLVLAMASGHPQAPALAASLGAQIPAAQILEAQQRAREVALDVTREMVKGG